MRGMSSTSRRGSVFSWALAVASIALAGAFATTLGGCSGESSSDDGGSGGSGGSGGTRLPNPCTLATPAELGSIVGVELVRSEEIRSLSGDPSCTWYDADHNGVFVLSLWTGTVQYDFSEQDARSVPLSGIGSEAHLGNLATVHVKLSNGNAFFTQSMEPAADSRVSSEVQSAASATMMESLLRYEAAFRFAKLVINDL